MSDTITEIDCETGEETTRPLSPDEQEQRDQDAAGASDRAWEELRAQRDAKLAASDFTQLNDVGATYSVEEQTAWAEYRQSLRDLPEATSEPTNPPWPEPPPSGERVEPFLLNALNPANVVQNGGDVAISVLGSGFDATAIVVFDGVELATAFRSDVELSCTIDASVGGHAAGTFDVFVRRGAESTSALPFTIEAA